MVRNTSPIPYNTARKANAERLVSGEMTDATLDTSRYVEIFSQEGNSKTGYAPGLGVEAREYARGYADMDIQVTNDGGSTYEDLSAKLRWEVYDDPEKENLVAYSSTFRASQLRGAVAEALTDKPVMAAEQPVAGDDSYIVLAAKVDSAQDGYVIDGAQSSEDAGIPYSRFK